MDSLPDESQLIIRAKAGDQEAMTRLYEHHASAIFQFVGYRVDSQMVAEDITSEVFLRMVRELPKFEDRGLPFGAWLFRIATNLLHDFYRNKHLHPTTQLSDIEPSHDTDPIDRLERLEARQALRDALKTLTQDQQDVLILRFMQDLSHAEVAIIMNKSEIALRTIQHRALKALGKKLDVLDKHRSYFRGKKPL
jgi:RNA polymerase sigma-70 factor (ECF subfamily)